MRIVSLILIFLAQWACGDKGYLVSENPNTEFPEVSTLPTFSNYDIETDKAVYNPGDGIQFILDVSSVPSDAKVRYKYLGEVVDVQNLSGTTWIWHAPEQDFCAYMVEVYSNQNEKETIYATIAVDISSDWTKFPRYGFLSDYSDLSDETINSVIKNLNRHHINGLQFYDWHNKHHQPMATEGDAAKAVWKDVANRDIYLSTVERYIAEAHEHNIKTMFYNLVYGAWEDAAEDGVKDQWYIFKDANHTTREVMTLPKPMFQSDIYLLDPSNTEWQAYINKENKKVYEYLDFDGYHMDQLGDWGLHYTYKGAELNLDKTFNSFIESIKQAEPDKFIAMNAVNQYGQQYIAAAPSDFLYSEVWDPNNSYNDLALIIQNNYVYSGKTKNTILAAYMNYDLAEKEGYFNTPGVLLTNAVIFAFGGAHLELGEHMLGKEYFPNNNLKMKSDLKMSLVHYYDFLVAYENILRDGGTFNSIAVSSIQSKAPVDSWPAKTGNIATVCKKSDNKQVIHLINFKDANTTEWRDNEGTQSMPALLEDIQMNIQMTDKVRKVWFASPDVIGGSSVELNFTQEDGELLLTVPQLKYWSMLVLEME